MGLLDKFKKENGVTTADILKMRKLFEEGKHEERLALIDKAYSNKSAVYYYTRGNCLCSLERYEEALASYRKAIKLDAKYVKAHYRIGQIMFQHQIFAKAEEAFEEVIKLEAETELLEWSNAAAFYIALCRNYQYQESKDPDMLESRDRATKYLKENFKFDHGEKELFEFFEESFQDILDYIEPDIMVDFRIRKKGKSSGSKVVIKDGKYKVENY